MEAPSNLVGKSSFFKKELIEGNSFEPFDKFLQMRTFSGWTTAINGDTTTGPRQTEVISSKEKGPEISPALISF